MDSRSMVINALAVIPLVGALSRGYAIAAELGIPTAERRSAA